MSSTVRAATLFVYPGSRNARHPDGGFSWRQPSPDFEEHANNARTLSSGFISLRDARSRTMHNNKIIMQAWKSRCFHYIFGHKVAVDFRGDVEEKLSGYSDITPTRSYNNGLGILLGRTYYEWYNNECFHWYKEIFIRHFFNEPLIRSGSIAMLKWRKNVNMWAHT